MGGYPPLPDSRERRERYLAIATIIQCCCTIWLTLFSFLLIVYSVRAGISVKVYLDSADITPARFGGVVNQTFDIIKNVDEISENVVPLSYEARKSIVNGTSNTSTVVGDVLSNTYKSFTEVTRTDWKNLVTNFTSVLASVARVNHSSVTNLIGDLHTADMQRSIRTRVDKTLSTVESAGHNAFDIFKTFKKAMSYNASEL